MRDDDAAAPGRGRPNARGNAPSMVRNQKLTAVLAGRSITAVDSRGGTVMISFDDGSTMTVQSDGTEPAGARAGRVKAVRQRGTTLALDFDDGGTLTLRTAEETSSVMVRDKSHGFEYSD